MYRSVINGKAGKAAALPKFSDTLTLSQSGGVDYAQPLALPHLKKIVMTPLIIHSFNEIKNYSRLIIDDDLEKILEKVDIFEFVYRYLKPYRC